MRDTVFTPIGSYESGEAGSGGRFTGGLRWWANHVYVSSVKPNHSGKRGGDLSSSPVMLTIRNLPDIIIGPERPNVISCVDIGLLQAVDSELNPAKF
jgi:hypothetical protein